MNYDCANEFNLNEIYLKLIAPIAPTTVKASEFFNQRKFSLAEFQKQLATIVGETQFNQ